MFKMDGRNRKIDGKYGGVSAVEMLTRARTHTYTRMQTRMHTHAHTHTFSRECENAQIVEWTRNSRGARREGETVEARGRRAKAASAESAGQCVLRETRAVGTAAYRSGLTASREARAAMR